MCDICNFCIQSYDMRHSFFADELPDKTKRLLHINIINAGT